MRVLLLYDRNEILELASIWHYHKST